MTPLAPPATPSKVMGRIGWSLAVAGLLIAAVSITILVLSIGGAVREGFSNPTYPTPMDETIHLDHGSYLVYELNGEHRNGVIESNGTTLSPQDVHITDPDGRAVSTRYPSSTNTIDRNGDVYTGAIEFRADRAGRYEVRVDDPGSRPRVLVAKDVVSQFVKALVWIGGLVGGGFVLVAGAIVLIIYWTRKNRANRPPPPGWYPDGSGALRWWTGYCWVPPG